MYEQLSYADNAPQEVAAEQDTQQPAAEQAAPAVRYYGINEQIARAANDMNSMRCYKEGSATAEYRAYVDTAAALVESKKAKVSPFYHEKLDHLLDSYARRLASYFNDYYRNEASCPSILVSGGSNFPVRKKEKQNSRRDTLMHEYKDIQSILDKIKSIGTGPVDLADPHAREMLEDQLERVQKQLDNGKALNAYYRKHKSFEGFPGLDEAAAAKLSAEFAATRERCPWVDKPFPDYELTSLRGKIKRLQARIDELDKRAEQAAAPAGNATFDGGEIVRNIEADRLQIIFDDKPDEDMRAKLKSNGFRWSPRYGAWQRQLTDNAERAARQVLGI